MSAYEEGHALFFKRVATQRMIPRPLTSVAWDVSAANFVADEMLVTLSAFVLTDSGGPPASLTEHYVGTRFPRWMPKWLRRRWSEPKQVTLTVQPYWTYPQATRQFPDLGPAVRKYTTEVLR